MLETGGIKGWLPGKDAVAEHRVFPGGNGQAGPWQKEAQSGHELNEGFVVDQVIRLKIAFGFVEPGQGDRHLGIQVVVLEIAGMQAAKIS